jgi:hypothetical protein
MKADLRISVKDYSRNKNRKVLVARVPPRQFFVRMRCFAPQHKPGDVSDRTVKREGQTPKIAGANAVVVKREGRHVADPQSGTAARRPSPRLDTL